MKYIFVEYCITGIGGGQNYISNKTSYLISKGWEVFVFSQKRNIGIVYDNLKPFEKYEIKELKYSPLSYSKKHTKGVLQNIIKSIDYHEGEQIIIESGYENGAYWGEMIAKETKARHIVFLLLERTSFIKDCYIPFFEFKQNRSELAGIKKESIIELFAGRSLVLEHSEPLVLVVKYNDDTVADVDYEWMSKIKKDEINICCFGRLAKPYIPHMIDELVLFCEKNHDKKISIIILGGDSTEESKLIGDRFARFKNVQTVMPGSVYPIPRKLFPLCSLVLGSSGCALIAYRERTITVTIDVNDYKCIGVLGYTTKNYIARQEEEPIEVHQLVEDVLFNHYLDNKSFSYDQIIAETDYAEHLLFAQKEDSRMTFYDFSNVKGRMVFRTKRIARELVEKQRLKA